MSLDIVVTDRDRRDLRVQQGADLDLAFGSDENNFVLTCDASCRIDYGALVYVEGTEYGGMVDKSAPSTGEGIVRYKGPTWHGLLNAKVVCPDRGAARLHVEGEANAVLLQLLERLDLADLFTVRSASSELRIDYTFDRFPLAYFGIRKMLRSSGAKLKMAYVGGRVELWAEDISDYSGARGLDSDRVDVELEHVERPCNHLISLGVGENEDRVEVHHFADEQRRISQVQTIFGVYERTSIYDYNNADAEELLEKGAEKLRELQETDSCRVTIDPDREMDVDDLVSATAPASDVSIASSVTKKVVRISRGEAAIEYEVGGTAASSSLSGASESGPGGPAYTAGKGIDITGRTISAEVDADDLGGVEDVAEEALRTASDAGAAAGEAVRTITVVAPVVAERDNRDVSLSLSMVTAAEANAWFA